MGEKVKADGKNIRITRASGYLYYTKGDPISIYRTKMQHRGRTKSKQSSTLVLKTQVVRNSKYLYYISSDSCLSRSKRKGVK
jgi:hypothetical protein